MLANRALMRLRVLASPLLPSPSSAVPRAPAAWGRLLSSSAPAEKKKVSRYHEQGIDTLSFAVGPQHVIFPKTSITQMEKVLHAVLEMKPSQIVFHHFSVGGFLFGQMLRLMERDPKKYAAIQELAKAQVYDSPPDFRGIAKGIGASAGVSSPLRYPIQALTEAYLRVTQSTSGVEHRAASEAFHNNYMRAPALWFYSRSDPIANHEDCEIVIGKWRKAGTEVDECVWNDSLHIQHARRYPDEYFGTLGRFLHKAGVQLTPVHDTLHFHDDSHGTSACT